MNVGGNGGEEFRVDKNGDRRNGGEVVDAFKFCLVSSFTLVHWLRVLHCPSRWWGEG